MRTHTKSELSVLSVFMCISLSVSALVPVVNAEQDPELRKITESISASKQKLAEINAKIKQRDEERKAELRTMLANADYNPYKTGMLDYAADAANYTKNAAKAALTVAAGTKAGPISWIGYGGLVTMGGVEAYTKYCLTGDKTAFAKDLAITAVEIGSTAVIPGMDSKIVQTGAYIASDTIKGTIEGVYQGDAMIGAKQGALNGVVNAATYFGIKGVTVIGGAALNKMGIGGTAVNTAAKDISNGKVLSNTNVYDKAGGVVKNVKLIEIAEKDAAGNVVKSVLTAEKVILDKTVVAKNLADKTIFKIVQGLIAQPLVPSNDTEGTGITSSDVTTQPSQPGGGLGGKNQPGTTPSTTTSLQQNTTEQAVNIAQGHQGSTTDNNMSTNTIVALPSVSGGSVQGGGYANPVLNGKTFTWGELYGNENYYQETIKPLAPIEKSSFDTFLDDLLANLKPTSKTSMPKPAEAVQSQQTLAETAQPETKSYDEMSDDELRAAADTAADDLLARCNDALAKDPNNILANLISATVYDDPSGNKADKAKAIAGYNKVLSSDPQNADVLVLRGSALMSTGDTKGAIADFTEAIRLDPKNDTALMLRGALYSTEGDSEKAIADYSAAIAINPENKDALSLRADAYLEKGDFALAMNDYKSLSALGENVPDAFLQEISNQAKAAGQLMPVLLNAAAEQTQSKEVNTDAWSFMDKQELAELNTKLAVDPENANKDIAEWQQLTTLPFTGVTNTTANERPQNVVGGTLLKTGGKPPPADVQPANEVIAITQGKGDQPPARGAPKAVLPYGAADAKRLAELNQALQQVPNHTDLLYERGTMYKAHNEFDKAIQDFTNLIAIRTPDQSVFRMRAECYAETGNYTSALKDYERVKELGGAVDPQVIAGLQAGNPPVAGVNQPAKEKTKETAAGQPVLPVPASALPAQPSQGTSRQETEPVTSAAEKQKALEKKLNEKTSRQKELQGAIGNLQTQITRFETDNPDLAKQYREADGRHKKEVASYMSISAVKTQLSVEKEAAETERKNAQAVIDECIPQIERFTKELQVYEKRAEKLTETATALEQNKQTMADLTGKLKQALGVSGDIPATATGYDYLQRAIGESERNLAQMTGARKQKDDALPGLIADQKTLENDLATAQKAYDEVVGKYNNAMKAKQNAQKVLDETSLQQNMAQARVNEAIGTITTLSAWTVNANSTLQKLRKDLAQVEADLKKVQQPSMTVDEYAGLETARNKLVAQRADELRKCVDTTWGYPGATNNLVDQIAAGNWESIDIYVTGENTAGAWGGNALNPAALTEQAKTIDAVSLIQDGDGNVTGVVKRYDVKSDGTTIGSHMVMTDAQENKTYESYSIGESDAVNILYNKGVIVIQEMTGNEMKQSYYKWNGSGYDKIDGQMDVFTMPDQPETLAAAQVAYEAANSYSKNLFYNNRTAGVSQQAGNAGGETPVKIHITNDGKYKSPPESTSLFAALAGYAGKLTTYPTVNYSTGGANPQTVQATLPLKHPDYWETKNLVEAGTKMGVIDAQINQINSRLLAADAPYGSHQKFLEAWATVSADASALAARKNQLENEIKGWEQNLDPDNPNGYPQQIAQAEAKKKQWQAVIDVYNQAVQDKTAAENAINRLGADKTNAWNELQTIRKELEKTKETITSYTGTSAKDHTALEALDRQIQEAKRLLPELLAALKENTALTEELATKEQAHKEAVIAGNTLKTLAVRKEQAEKDKEAAAKRIDTLTAQMQEKQREMDTQEKNVLKEGAAVVTAQKNLEAYSANVKRKQELEQELTAVGKEVELISGDLQQLGVTPTGYEVVASTDAKRSEPPSARGVQSVTRNIQYSPEEQEKLLLYTKVINNERDPKITYRTDRNGKPFAMVYGEEGSFSLITAGDAYLLRGNIYASREDDKALADYTKAIEAPDTSDTFRELAQKYRSNVAARISAAAAEDSVSRASGTTPDSNLEQLAQQYREHAGIKAVQKAASDGAETVSDRELNPLVSRSADVVAMSDDQKSKMAALAAGRGGGGEEETGSSAGASIGPAQTATSDQAEKLAAMIRKSREEAGDVIPLETYTKEDGVEDALVGQAKTAYRIEKADGKENRVEISDIKYQAGPDGKPVAESYKEVHKAGRDGSGPEVKQVRKMQIERDAGGKETNWTQLVTKPGNTPGDKVRTIETVRNSQVVSSVPQGGGRAGAVQQAGAEGAQRQGGGFSRQSRSDAVKARQQRIQSSGDRMTKQIDQSAAETAAKMIKIDAAINQANFMNKARAGQQADLQGVKTQKHLGGQGEQPQQQNQQ